MALSGLAPSAAVLVAAVLLDAAAGDPQYAWHPIRLLGRTLAAVERILMRLGLDGYGGGCLLFLLLALVWIVLPCWLVHQAALRSPALSWTVQVLLVYSLLALGDLLDHVWAVQGAAQRCDLAGARTAIALMVGRDVSAMDLAACRRAAIESLSENFVDGYLSAILWYAWLGLPGLLLFKVASTMDSMVGYKTPRYLRFGWCGARLDDVMNYLPARAAWLGLGLGALLVPGAAAGKGWRIGLQQHALVPGPNPGWSEATMAGILQRRLIGPIWKGGELVTTLWLGFPSDPEGGNDADVTRAVRVVAAASLLTIGGAVLLLL